VRNFLKENPDTAQEIEAKLRGLLLPQPSAAADEPEVLEAGA